MQVKVYLANLKLNRIYHFEKQKIIANDYLTQTPLHIHFKCSNCNVIIDIDDADINLDYIKLNQKVEMKRELEVNDVNITLLGLCKKCREELHGKTN